ncbi:DUF4435 domain-containing protein [Rahnella sp. RcJ3]|uniref:DUF4435 domain-containing protein n=1 Tax=Rahnella sp. RcJ3 TaxID=2292446 RepID=UPI0012962029|nr:DUF4435 domain-containing protein [Rahnella sp. RcJ3]MQB53392.1 DUF4435 domain-containing protein [Rahnella sp. RcJ3]
MPTIPVYDIEENLRRVDMQRRIKFIIVEGKDDVPIYESLVSSAIEGIEFDVIYSGGKPRIKKFLEDNQELVNCIVIVDRDFDLIDIESERLVFLERYSIENFYFCEDVIKSVIAMSLKMKKNDALEIVDLHAFIEYSTPLLLRLFYAIHYYQRVVVAELNMQGLPSPGWSDTFICMNDSWKVCPDKIEELIHNLYQNGYNEQLAKEYYETQYISSGNILADFPGKMLKVALQRYLKDSVIRINPKFGSKFSNTDTTCTLLMSNLHHSSTLKTNLQPVFNFLSA